ncbi:hypothetical protein CH75_16645 [Dyella jiangningensis]|jgi:hypothetical protein|uniref:hypothetical protein n=1 Tax=Dyella jiangningensis TaxID=1379159 RepID=UPI00045629EF|nr:hypothetical protein [Dyella jiangningensis]AHX14659.1 hypothetical protein CH75_16645 [Dyella jiangningensis]MDG2537916.1 hypothetical protein [Dyella jiangningensis]
MRYLAILLLAPWLLILGWAYWSYPKSLPRTPARRSFDLAALLLAAFAAVECASTAFDTASVPAVGQYGPASGAIWQQVLPALYGYGACVVVLVLAMIVRHLLWRPRAN